MIRGLAIMAASIALTGCFEIEHTVRLRQDFSGELTTSATLDFEEGHRYDLWNGGTHDDKDVPSLDGFCGNFAAGIARVKEILPPGTSLADSSCRTEGGKVLLLRRFTFDHVSKLPSVLAIGMDGFGGIHLHVREEGATWLLSAAGEDLGVLDNLQELMPNDESEMEQAKAVHVRGSFTLLADPKVVQHTGRMAGPWCGSTTACTRPRGGRRSWSVWARRRRPRGASPAVRPRWTAPPSP